MVISTGHADQPYEPQPYEPESFAVTKTSSAPDTRPTTRPEIWIISDGTAGMRLQSLALAEAMGWTTASGFRDIIVTPRQPLRSLPFLGRISMLAPHLPISTPALPYADGGFPDILVTCGRRMAGLSIAVRHRARIAGQPIKTIHIQDPRLDPACFDILLVPAHDPVRGDNVIVSTGSLNRLTPETIADAAHTLAPKWKNAAFPRVVVMLGGDNRRYKISPAMASRMVARLDAFARQTKASLAIVPSRRTPPDLIRQLTETLALNDTQARHRLATPQDANPYPGILGIADAIIVTSDSVNMTSEATITGTPVMVADWHSDAPNATTSSNATSPATSSNATSTAHRQIETGRLAAFHDAMMQGGHTVPLGDVIPDHDFIPLDDMPSICAKVKTLLAQS